MQVYWLEQSAADVPNTDDWLGANELAVLGTLRFPRRRADWRLGRWTAKRAVAAVLQLPANHRALQDIAISAAINGEPQVETADRVQAVTLSISHRDGLAACAVALGRAALGCDLELIEPKSAAFIADYLTVDEQALLVRSDSSAQPLLASLLWSAKESALKALHIGLRADTRSVEVDPGELNNLQGSSLDWRPLCVRAAAGPDFRGWWRVTGSGLRTLLAAPPPLRPIELHLSVTPLAHGPRDQAGYSVG